MPRFSVRILLLSMTAVAFGIGVLAAMLKGVPYRDPGTSTVIMIVGSWFLGGGMIGGGVGLLFGKPVRGIVVALVVMALLFVVLLMPTQ